jgi:hypothetical protein
MQQLYGRSSFGQRHMRRYVYLTIGRLLTYSIQDVTQVFTCGDGILNNNEECDRGVGCSAECTCNAGFTPQNSTDCAASK